MKGKKRSRTGLTLAAAVLIISGLAAAFWPRSVIVDMGEARRGDMILSIQEEGRTRVHDTYVVSTPVAGRLLRVDLLPGDPVERGETVIAEMRPTNPAALDVRTREQAYAAVRAAEAALRVAQSELNAAIADKDLASADLERARALAEKGTISQATLDRAMRSELAAAASLETATAAIAMREAELANVRAQLIGFDDRGLADALGAAAVERIELRAPVDGQVLRVLQKSETTLPAGAPVMELGDVANDLEVVVQLLSTDAVKVSVGDRVIIADWGGEPPLAGEVTRVDPYGVTKFSALGVEEQRVDGIIRFVDPPQSRASLGHGFRVETRIVVWEGTDVLIVPSSALFRAGSDWAVFVVDQGRARTTIIDVGQNNGIEAEVLAGLEDGDRIILFPSAGLTDGTRVEQRKIQ